MNVKFIEGNILDSKTDVICHQVNCKGFMNSGVAKAIRDKYPKVFELYKEYCKLSDILGKIQMCQVSPNKYICNLFGQNDFGYNGSRYTSYDAVYDALTSLRVYMAIHDLQSVSIPYKMSSVRGGANWDVIYCMICQIFKDSKIKIEIWKLE